MLCRTVYLRYGRHLIDYREFRSGKTSQTTNDIFGFLAYLAFWIQPVESLTGFARLLAVSPTCLRMMPAT